jgi:hypothetical protein
VAVDTRLCLMGVESRIVGIKKRHSRCGKEESVFDLFVKSGNHPACAFLLTPIADLGCAFFHSGSEDIKR